MDGNWREWDSMRFGFLTINYILIISNVFYCCLGSVFFSIIITLGNSMKMFKMFKMFKMSNV